MKHLLTIALITMLAQAQANAKRLTAEEEALLKTLKKSGEKALVKKDTKKKRVNKKLRVVRDDARIMNVSMSVNDRTDLLICYASPMIVKFGPTSSKA